MPDIALKEVFVIRANNAGGKIVSTMYSHTNACRTDFNEELAKDLIGTLKVRKDYDKFKDLLSVSSKNISIPSLALDSMVYIEGKIRLRQSSVEKTPFSILLRLENGVFNALATAPREFVMTCLGEPRLLSSIGIFLISRPELFEGVKIHTTAKSTVLAGGRACFIATAVYGNYNCVEVQMLRKWRDENLAHSQLGRICIGAYNTIGPFLAALVLRRILPRFPFALAVDRIIHKISKTF